MRPFDIPPAPPGPDGSDRTVSSAMVHAAHTLSGWLKGMGLMCLILAGCMVWFLKLTSRFEAMVAEANGQPADLFIRFEVTGTVLCSVLAGLNAFCFLRCGAGLSRFAASRRVGDLHVAMRRLRVVWGCFALTLTIALTLLLRPALLHWVARQF